MPNEDDPLSAIYNYEPIADWIGTSGQPTEPQFLDIANAGYRAVINLALPSSDNAIANEGSIVTKHGMAYFHIPVDFDKPTVEDLRLFFGVVRPLRGQRVWVHCVVNARVSAFVYQYLRHVEGLDDEAARTRFLQRWLGQMNDVWREFLAIPKSLIT